MNQNGLRGYVSIVTRQSVWESRGPKQYAIDAALPIWFWLSSDQSGLGPKTNIPRRRIDQADDWVRQEIELARDRTVIPVAFGGAGIPPAEALPESISYLASRQGVSVRDEFVDTDLQPVLLAIEQSLPSAEIRGSVDAARGDRRHLPYPQPPLIVKPAPMAEEDIKIAIQEVLHDWDTVVSPLPEDPAQTRVELHRTFLFRSFRDVLAFMVEVGDFADDANHHPRWENIFKTPQGISDNVGYWASHFAS